MTSGSLALVSSSTIRKRRFSNGSIKMQQELSNDSSSSNSNTFNSKGITKKRKTRCCRILDKEEIIKYFSVKEEEAAQLLNVSKSKLKRIKKEMGISRWPFRRLEALKQELQDIEHRIHQTCSSQQPQPQQTVTTINTTTTTSQCYLTTAVPQLSSSTINGCISSLLQEESILLGSIELIHHIPNIIVKHSNDHIKEIARKTQRISLSNLLNL